MFHTMIVFSVCPNSENFQRITIVFSFGFSLDKLIPYHQDVNCNLNSNFQLFAIVCNYNLIKVIFFLNSFCSQDLKVNASNQCHLLLCRLVLSIW